MCLLPEVGRRERGATWEWLEMLEWNELWWWKRLNTVSAAAPCETVLCPMTLKTDHLTSLCLAFCFFFSFSGLQTNAVRNIASKQSYLRDIGQIKVHAQCTHAPTCTVCPLTQPPAHTSANILCFSYTLTHHFIEEALQYEHFNVLALVSCYRGKLFCRIPIAQGQRGY